MYYPVLLLKVATVPLIKTSFLQFPLLLEADIDRESFCIISTRSTSTDRNLELSLVLALSIKLLCFIASIIGLVGMWKTRRLVAYPSIRVNKLTFTAEAVAFVLVVAAVVALVEVETAGFVANLVVLYVLVNGGIIGMVHFRERIWIVSVLFINSVSYLLAATRGAY